MGAAFPVLRRSPEGPAGAAQRAWCDPGLWPKSPALSLQATLYRVQPEEGENALSLGLNWEPPHLTPTYSEIPELKNALSFFRLGSCI